MHTRNTSLKRSTVVLAVGVLAIGTGLSTGTSYAADRAKPTARASLGKTQHEQRGAFDARYGTSAAAKARLARTAARAAARPSTRSLRRSLGDQGLVDIDGTTGTPRLVGRLDGFLTGASSASPRSIALGYVRAHETAFGLTGRDLTTLHFRQDYVDIAGTHHLSWTQRIGGVEVFGNGLDAAVTRTGRLLMIGGSPVSGADAPPAGARRIGTAAAAISAARRKLGEPTTPGRRDVAGPVLFVTRTGTHLGWRVVTMSASQPALSVVDAHTARLLYRRSLSSDANSGDSGGLAYAYFPGHRPGGEQVSVDYTRRGWLPATARTLSGNNSHTYSDVDDDNLAESSEEVPPSAGNRWDYPLQPFHLSDVSFCDNPFPCSWDPDTPFSWQANRAQNAAQVFFYVNNWHDHLLAAPIGFTEAAGNFQVTNRTHRGKGGDPVDTQTDDGANTSAGLPDGNHLDNANMSTPPDGQSPTMQMYLQHQPGTTYPDGDPFSPTNVGDEADTVYHEYTHGLSNRLVVDPSGDSTLGVVQAGAMGEAWSDWYAMDYLVDQHLQTDDRRAVDVVLFQYDGAGVALDRTQPMDCKVGSTAEACNGGDTGHSGGYTYADYGQVFGLPEVHSDGEIWAETLWDLRDALGSAKSESLVTRAMELSPANPSFLDERNAILMADTALFGGRDQHTIWSVFAHRGMGFYAGSLGADDAAPGADFHTPPHHPATATITGAVTDPDTGAPVSGATVTLAFQGGSGPVNPSATTGDDGTYQLGPVPVGTYQKLQVSAPGFDPVTTAVTVTGRGAVEDFTLRRDWASETGGASISDFNGPDYSPVCGPDGAIDNSLSTGWGSTTGDDAGDPTNVFVPKHITVRLPQGVDVSQFAVDPSATCGDGASASTGAFSIETSQDGTTWTTAATGSFTSADLGRLNPIVPTAGSQGVTYVRFTILGNQTPDFATSCPDGAFSGCSYTDLTELEVYGAPAS
ncbi:M36 family metallopeptidase [Nocardioides cheoyonin]|uniref:M36 family metallopeptidase n=1 Tax=Nocardioides cheoyonin TaxID=3156615 RepID=UPI0032B49F62